MSVEISIFRGSGSVGWIALLLKVHFPAEIPEGVHEITPHTSNRFAGKFGKRLDRLQPIRAETRYRERSLAVSGVRSNGRISSDLNLPGLKSERLFILPRI